MLMLKLSRAVLAPSWVNSMADTSSSLEMGKGNYVSMAISMKLWMKAWGMRVGMRSGQDKSALWLDPYDFWDDLCYGQLSALCPVADYDFGEDNEGDDEDDDWPDDNEMFGWLAMLETNNKKKKLIVIKSSLHRDPEKD